MGDDDNPNIRSRLVAQEIRMAGQDAIFAPTPPLESLRMTLSMAIATLTLGNANWKPVYEPHSEERMQAMLIDICRAYFNAETSEDYPVYV